MKYLMPLDQLPFSCRDAHFFLDSEIATAEDNEPMLGLRCPQSIEQGPGPLLLMFYCGGNVDGPEGIKASEMRITPTGLSVVQESLTFDAVFSNPRSLVLYGSGKLALKTVAAATGAFGFRLSATCWRIDFPKYQRKLLLQIHKGGIEADIGWNGQYGDRNRFYVSGDDEWVLSIVDYEDGLSLENPFPDLMRAQQWVVNDWNDWLAGPVCLSSEVYQDIRLAANYIQWSHQIGPRQGRSSPSILSSLANNAVFVVYEQCVHAVAIHLRHPQLAWDLWRGSFDLMSDSGQVPEQFSAIGNTSHFCAPPLHGWALMQMIQRGWMPNSEQIKEAVQCLEQNSRWWLENCLNLANGMPSYRHGRDSGWGESSLFVTPPPFQTPDLFALLVIQLDILITLHGFWDKPGDASFWETSRRNLTQFMQEQMWFGSEYVAIGSDAKPIYNNQSLLKMLPLILGTALPSEHLKSLVSELQTGGYISEYGLSSEAIGSRWFQRQSVQRGGVWPVGNYLIVRGLVEAGNPSLARTVSQNLLRSVARGGFGEAYNVLSGFAIGSPVSPVTASIFTSLLDEM